MRRILVTGGAGYIGSHTCKALAAAGMGLKAREAYDDLNLSIVIPTYGRDEVLCETLRHLLALSAPAAEIVVVDQTTDHGPPTSDYLAQQHAAGGIRWLRQAPPGTVGAMNRGLLEARGELVLFLDDDIIPGAELVAAQRRAHAEHPEAWAVVGRVLQPEDWDLPTGGKEDTGLSMGVQDRKAHV
jgi:GT2 family glycosyltransferase